MFSHQYLGIRDTQRLNKYSMVLLRAAFIHRDYMDLYMTNLPRTIFDSVATHFNCEDIAMSMFVTALRGGKSHLLADLWAITSMVKLYSPSSISTTIGHKFKRHQCVAEFAKELQLFEGKTALRARTLVHNPKTAFEHGVPLGASTDK